MLNTLAVVIITAFITVTSVALDLRKNSLCANGGPFCNTLVDIYLVDNFINNCIYLVSMVCLLSISGLAMMLSMYIIMAIIPIAFITVTLYGARLLAFLWRIEANPTRDSVKEFFDMK
jgi:hypothetical protein